MKISALFAALLLLAASAAAQTSQARVDTLKPGSNLVVQGVPPIPNELVAAVKKYTEAIPVGFGDWHPTRREMLVGKRAGNTGQVHIVTSPLATPRQLTDFPAAVMTGAATTEGFKTEIHVVNPADPASAKLISSLDGVGWGVLDWSPDDKKLLIGQYISVNESYAWLLDLETGEKTLLTPKTGDEKISYGGAEFSYDGKGIYLTTDKGSEFQRLSYMDIATRTIKPLTSHIDWDVDGFELSADGKLLAFTTNEDGITKFHVIETATGKEIKLPALPVGEVGGYSWHRKTNELGMTIISYQSIADVYSLGLKTKKLTHWAKAELHGYDTSGLRAPELVRWKSFDAKTISGFYYRPPAKFTGKRPVIINIHGGPEGQATPGPLGRNGYLVNELGIAMIYPNVRGSSGYGKTFLKLDNGYQREDSVKDIGALLDWIATQPDLDKDRVMVTGGSYGGYMTLAVATNYNDRICCSLD
ncbi:MAG: prolyl oligopeptidase family serine peptidase, partial [Acidobacteria bacterium]|nr:prolyl oligopeptidase family serine peptidase [Acidobacteriota bacterium]